MAPALGACSLNHWTTREIPCSAVFMVLTVTGIGTPFTSSRKQAVSIFNKISKVFWLLDKILEEAEVGCVNLHISA